MRSVRVVAWEPSTDVAVLDLVTEGLPPGASPAHLGDTQSLTKFSDLQVFGYSDTPPWGHAVSASLLLHRRSSRGLMQLEAETKPSLQAIRGLSGSPVVATDEEGNDVVIGMLTRGEEDSNYFYAVPISGLSRVWPDLLSHMGEGLSSDTLDSLIEGDAEIAAAVALRGESQWVELKSDLPQVREVAKQLTAFANSDGGVLVVGVNENGSPVGWQSTDADMALRRIRGVADSLLPGNATALKGHTAKGWFVWAVVRTEDEPIVTAEGSYWTRTLSQTRQAEWPTSAPIEQATLRTSNLSSRSSPDQGPIRVFVAMSFREEEEPALVDYWNAMLRAAKRARTEFDLRRIDQIEGDYEIVERIYEEIDAAQIVIADLTLSPPNVYLELGYARGRRKRVIQTCRENTILEFDVRGRRTLLYRNATILEEKLLHALDEL